MPRIGTVTLRVANLARQVQFYQDTIGLQLHHEQDGTVFLGAGGDDLLALKHLPDGKRYRGHNGLYHFALLLPTRRHLANVLRHLAATETPLQGVSDHIVSEAIYLPDPEGNGIEIYADRPREAWYQRDQMQMATLPLDVMDLIGEIDPIADHLLPVDTIMGHIHLHVHSVAEAKAFYCDTLGMDVMFDVGTAGFYSYDEYHHHVGANTWAGAPVHAPDALGLDHFVLHVDHADIYSEEMVDPSGNVLRIK